MSIKRPTLVIFDMDGTTVRHINPWILPVLERLDDIAYVTSKLIRWVFVKRKPDDPLLPPEIKPRKKSRLLVHRALHKVRRKEVDQIVEPCPGVLDVLQYLQTHNVPMAMVSNGLGKGYGHDILATFELEQYFSGAVFREDIHKSKPHPEALHLALERLGVKPKKSDCIWVIGDRRKDMLAAAALKADVKADVVPIAYGLNAALAIVEKGLPPEHIVTSFYDVKDKLRPLLGKAPKKNGAPKKKTA